ncbi:N-acetylglutaminylglutamine amidotransferase [Vulgatibacter sp.]|uniref:N-acetylglutaminylglutamine amidotransferase n=1 Tax=Vulgatibacter sp. TaxID=1971226 RepID=UPI003567912A
MCGFSGEIRFDGSVASVPAVAAMTEALAPRGPDGAGVHAQGRVALGHRRLKIIDLSDHAAQPMVDSDLGLSLVFNGCIYNYKELRAELEERGYRFFSSGDTEVLLKAYHAFGPAFVERLQGMFAFCIVERDSGRVVLGRDRLGIKPLYLAESGSRLRFASTLPALLAGGEVDTTIDEVALHHYMHFHSVVPPPRTILRGVRKLPPATVAVIDADGNRRDTRYWEPRFEPRAGDEKLSARDWEDLTLDTLRRAVRRRLVADVPVGVLLSGGLDSSLIVGLLAEEGQKGLSTFSIGFETVNGEAGDEFQYSDIVARHFGTDHHKIAVDSKRALPALERCIAAMSEPMVSHDNVGFFLLSEEVSKHVKVVQSGQGADEIFAGYHWYPPMLESNDAVGDYGRVFFDRDPEEYAATMQPRWVGADHSRAFVEEHFARPGASRAVDKALRIDTTVMLVDDPVKRVDNQTMAFGLEARVPFLDHEVVELGARIPAEYKVAQGGKGVLKEAGRRVIPHEVIDRPKGYFPVPALKYLQGPYLERVKETLGSRQARERGLFQADRVATLLADPEKHITPLRGSKLWQVALLELWLQSHGL